MNLISKKVGLALAVAAALVSVQAQAKTATASMTVTVKNAFNFDKTQDMSFGEVRAVHDPVDTKCVGIFLSPDPLVTQFRALDMANDLPTSQPSPACTATTVAKMTSLGGTPVPAVFEISDAANYTDMKIDIPRSTTIENPNPTGVDLAYVYPTAYRTTGTAGDIDLNCSSAVCTATVQTDDTGGLTFNLGGGLITEPGTTVGSYGDGPTAFTGSVTVTVTYL